MLLPLQNVSQMYAIEVHTSQARESWMQIILQRAQRKDTCGGWFVVALTLSTTTMKTKFRFKLIIKMSTRMSESIVGWLLWSGVVAVSLHCARAL